MSRPPHSSFSASGTSYPSDAPTLSASPMVAARGTTAKHLASFATNNTTSTTTASLASDPSTFVRRPAPPADGPAPSLSQCSQFSGSASPPHLNHHHHQHRHYRLHCDFLLHTLEAKAKTLDRCTYAFFYLAFVIMFCCYFVTGYDVRARYELHAGLLGPLSAAELPRLKSQFSLEDISTATEYTRYITDGVAPLLASVLAPTGSSIPLGALRVRTQRSLLDGCGDPGADTLTAFYSAMTCPDNAVADREDTGRDRRVRFNLEKMWRYRTCAELGGSWWASTHGVLDSYHCGGFLYDAPLWVAWDGNTSATGTVDSAEASGDAVAPSLGTAEQAFPFTAGTLLRRRVSLQRLYTDDLQRLFWKATVPFLDDYATRVAITEALFYNPPLQLFAAVKLVGEVTRSGSWKTTAQLRTARVWTRDDAGTSAFGLVVMAMAVVWLVHLTAHGVLFVRQRVAERMGEAAPSRSRRGASGRSSSFTTATTATSITSIETVEGKHGPPLQRRKRKGWDSSGLALSSPAVVRLTAVVDFVLAIENLSAVVILGLFFTSAALRISAVVHSVHSVPTLDVLFASDTYPMQLEYLFFNERVQLYVNATLVILLFYRLLCFVVVDTNAARLMQLLARTQSVLSAYLCLSLLGLMTYALTLNTLYGRNVWSLRSVDSAFGFLIRVMTRQHDTYELAWQSIGVVQTALLLLAFQIMAVISVFSLATAIFVHALSEMRREEPSPALDAYQVRWLLDRSRRCLLSPSLWGRFVWRWCSGQGDAALLRHAAHCLRGYRAIKYPALDHVEGELRQLVARDDFLEAMQYAAATDSDDNRGGGGGGEGDGAFVGGLSGIWMTWVTRSSSSRSSNISVGGGRGGGGGGEANSSSPSLSFLETVRSSNGSEGGRGEREEVDGGDVEGGQLGGHSSRSRSADAQEWQRRRWQERWGHYPPEEIWVDVCRDWVASTTSEASLHFREEVVWLRSGVQSAVGDNLTLVKKFPRRLAELERKLKVLESHFGENELIAADKADREERAESGG